MRRSKLNSAPPSPPSVSIMYKIRIGSPPGLVVIGFIKRRAGGEAAQIIRHGVGTKPMFRPAQQRQRRNDQIAGRRAVRVQRAPDDSPPVGKRIEQGMPRRRAGIDGTDAGLLRNSPQKFHLETHPRRKSRILFIVGALETKALATGEEGLYHGDVFPSQAQ